MATTTATLRFLKPVEALEPLPLAKQIIAETKAAYRDGQALNGCRDLAEKKLARLKARDTSRIRDPQLLKYNEQGISDLTDLLAEIDAVSR